MDILENGSDEHGDDAGAPDEETTLETFLHPGVLGLTALVLAVLSLFGAAVLRGSSYTLMFVGVRNVLEDDRGPLVAAGLVTALIALLPVLIARLGIGRLVPDDAAWCGHVLRSAYLLGALSFVLALVRVLLVAAASHPTLSTSLL